MAETGVATRSAREQEWRRAQLKRSGFASSLARRVVEDGQYDLHLLIELAERGCPPELAVRILAPLDDRSAPPEGDIVA